MTAKKTLRLTRTLHLGQESIIIQLNTERGGSYGVEKRLSEKITRPVKGLSLIHILLFMVLSKADLRTLLPSSLCMGTGLFFASIAALAAIISTNFTKYFILFHHMFFNNDLWILDPSTDMLINIVPEGFFMDTAGRIAFLFGSLSLILFGLCLIMTLKNKRRK